MKKVQLTKQGFEKLQKEFEELKNIKRPQAIERLQKARGMGDLSENSEYAAAKESLDFIDQRIIEIETMIKNSQIVSQNNNHSQVVDIGSLVVVDIEGEKEEFMIVGEYEADPLNKKLSVSSPIGQALFNRKPGETIEVQTPAGKKSYKITAIK
ncbi:MAG: transcription elongation factor GreA [Patescibacteria group bacterium]|nr:transcription elongation factor GreA [Patescibacteria group bacterium]